MPLDFCQCHEGVEFSECVRRCIRWGPSADDGGGTWTEGDPLSGPPKGPMGVCDPKSAEIRSYFEIEGLIEMFARGWDRGQ